MTPLLFVDHAPALGGAEHSLLLLLKHLDRARWRPHLACPGGPLAERAAALDVPVHVVALPRLRGSAAFPAAWVAGVAGLARLARELSRRGDLTGLKRPVRSGVVIANTARAAVYATPAARLAGCPFVWYARDFWLSES
ncbi:MAG: glycosyltransferase, partial [Chloroflexi bacterium]|nr:glycosyltransferase [Chloroflexota bacterium]